MPTSPNLLLDSSRFPCVGGLAKRGECIVEGMLAPRHVGTRARMRGLARTRSSHTHTPRSASVSGHVHIPSLESTRTLSPL